MKVSDMNIQCQSFENEKLNKLGKVLEMRNWKNNVLAKKRTEFIKNL